MSLRWVDKTELSNFIIVENLVPKSIQYRKHFERIIGLQAFETMMMEFNQ
jgi:hypothetical protein